MSPCARCAAPIGHQAEPGDEPLCRRCVDALVAATRPREPLALTVYAMRRYAYGALLEVSSLVIDHATGIPWLAEDGDQAEQPIDRADAAQLLATWRRDARRTARRDAAAYLGHDDSDRPRVEFARIALRRAPLAPQLAA